MGRRSAEVSFVVPGPCPSKPNFRMGRKGKNAATWGRIKDYQKQVGLLALEAGAKRYKNRKNPEVELVAYNQIIDLDNSFKVHLDSLEGIAFDNDREVRRIAAKRVKDSEEPRMEVKIKWGG